MSTARHLKDLIGRYWDIAYREGKEGCAFDTANGDAAACWHDIEQAIGALVAITPETGNATPQGASAITSETVPLLTDEHIDQITRDQWGAHAQYLHAAYRAYARAIEQAVRAKLGAGVPMTDEQRYSEFCNWYANAECQMTPSAIFDEAFRRAENAHGIVGKEGA